MTEQGDIAKAFVRPATRRGRPYLFALLAAAACGSQGPWHADADNPRAREPMGAPLSADGIDARFEGPDSVRRLQAAQVLVVPKQSGLFRVGGLYELVLTQVRVELSLDAAGGEGGGTPARADPVVAAATPTPPPRPGRLALPHIDGVIVGGTLYDVVCVAARAGREVTRASARIAKLDLHTGDLALRDLLVEHHPTGRVLETARATWRSRQRDLLVPGEYRIRDGSSVRSGRGAQLDLELRASDDPRRR